MSQTEASADSPLSPAAWGFVLQHSTAIDRAASRTWKDRRVPVEDFHHDLVIDLARNFHKFDPSRGSAVTWIYVRARSVADHLLRRMAYRKDQHHDTLRILGQPDDDGRTFDPMATAWGNHEMVTVRIEVSEVIALGTEAMKAAALSHLEGWTGDEVQASFGCTMTARNDRLHRLGIRAKEETHVPVPC